MSEKVIVKFTKPWRGYSPAKSLGSRKVLLKPWWVVVWRRVIRPHLQQRP